MQIQYFFDLIFYDYLRFVLQMGDKSSTVDVPPTVQGQVTKADLAHGNAGFGMQYFFHHSCFTRYIATICNHLFILFFNLFSF